MLKNHVMVNEKSNETLQKQVDVLKIDSTSKNDLIADLQEKLESANAVAAEKSKDLNTKNHLIEELRDKEVKLTNEKSEYIIKNQALQKNESELREQVSFATQKSKMLAEDVNNLRGELSQSRHDYNESDKNCKQNALVLRFSEIQHLKIYEDLQNIIAGKNREITMLQTKLGNRGYMGINETDSLTTPLSSSPILVFNECFTIPEAKDNTASTCSDADIQPGNQRCRIFS